MSVKIVVLEPNKKAYAKEVNNDLPDLQGIVGGYLESFPFVTPNGETYLCFCNEEGMIHDLPPNRRVNGQVIYGNFFISRFEGVSEIESLTDEDIKLFSSYL